MNTSTSISRRTLSGFIAGGSMSLLSISQSAEAREKVTQAFVNGGTVEDQLAIQQLLYRYGMAIDNLDAAAMADCFAPSAVLWGSGFTPKGDFAEFTVQTEGEFAKKLIEVHRAYEFTMHLMMNYLYTVQERSATGMTYGIYTYVVKKDGELKRLEGYTRYHDELIKQGDRWRFIKRRFENIFNSETPVMAFDSRVRSNRG